MSDKKFDFAQDGLGDVTALMSNPGVSDLSWLVVDEDEYRKHEALPKQNLDMIPELQQALSHPDKDMRIPTLIPSKTHVIVNQNPLERQSQASSSASAVRNRTARYVMAGLSSREAAVKLQSEFSPLDLQAAASETIKVVEERGLLGNVYVDSSHFPRCAQGEDRKFVAKTSGRALFVLSKPECSGCTHNSGGMCASFKKRIVDDVPYQENVLAHYAASLVSEGRPVDLDSPGDVREKLKVAFLKAPVGPTSDVQTVQTLPRQAAMRVTGEDVLAFVERRSGPSAPAPPSQAYLAAARRVSLGSAGPLDLAGSHDPQVRSLAKDCGLLGHTYVDVDAMGGCRATLSFVQERRILPDYFIRRDASCASCKDASDGACSCLRSMAPILRDRVDVDKTHFVSALNRALREGRILAQSHVSAVKNVALLQSADWRSLTIQVNLMKSSPKPAPVYQGARASVHHVGASPDVISKPMDPEEVRRFMSHLMNTGLHGRRLSSSILSRYSKADLLQDGVREVGSSLASSDGIQGTYFIDPTAYSDYGRGCSIGAARFRKQGAPNLMVGSSCVGCSLQTAPGWCSKYAKSLIRSVPDDVRESIVASRRRLPMAPLSVEDPVVRYELASDLTFEVSSPKPEGIEISLQDRHVE